MSQACARNVPGARRGYAAGCGCSRRGGSGAGRIGWPSAFAKPCVGCEKRGRCRGKSTRGRRFGSARERARGRGEAEGGGAGWLAGWPHRARLRKMAAAMDQTKIASRTRSSPRARTSGCTELPGADVRGACGRRARAGRAPGARERGAAAVAAAVPRGARRVRSGARGRAGALTRGARAPAGGRRSVRVGQGV